MEAEALAVNFTPLDWVWTFLLVLLMIICGVLFYRFLLDDLAALSTLCQTRQVKIPPWYSRPG